MNEKISKGKGLAMRDDERKASVSKMSRAAKEAMKEWKQQTGIKAIVPKTINQKIDQKRRNAYARKKDREDRRKMSLGAASEVRIIKLGEPK